MRGLSRICGCRYIVENIHCVSHSVLALSGSKVLLPMVLVLLIYTVCLRFVVNTCFLEVSTLFHLFRDLCVLMFPSESAYSVEDSSCCSSP